MKLILILVLLAFSQIHAPAQSVRTLVVPDSVGVGESFSFVILSSFDPQVHQVIYPDSTFFRDPFEFRSVRVFRGVQARDSVVYRIQYFGLNDTLLTSKPVRFVAADQSTSTVQTAPVMIYFRSNLTADVSELQPIKPIFQFARNWWPLILIILAVFVAIYLIWRYKDRIWPATPPPAIVAAPVPYVNPLSVLDETLSQLSHLHRLEHDAFKEFYFRISIAFRQYLEDVHEIPALESTTREVNHLMQRLSVSEEICGEVLHILRESDLVKFAKVRPAFSDAEATLGRSLALKELLRRQDQRKIQELRAIYELRTGIRKPDSSEGAPPAERPSMPLITPKPEAR